MQVTIEKAKKQLSRLIEAALAGEEVIIANGGKPMVRLSPIPERKFQFGLLAGKLGDGPDFFEPTD
jgi:prevent-host-death family protein